MSGPLNRLPLGILDFFGVKSGLGGGRYPMELGDSISPVLDQLFWLRSAATELVVQGGPTAVVSGALVDFTAALGFAPRPPVGEAWFIDRVGFFITATAGENNAFSPVIWEPPLGPTAVFPLTALQASTAGTWDVFTSDKPFLLLPGQTLTLRNHILGASGAVARINLRMLRVKL